MAWKQRFLLMFLGFGVAYALSFPAQAAEEPFPSSQNIDKTIITPEQLEVLNKEHDATLAPFPPTPSREEREKITKPLKPVQDRYQRLRQAVDYFSQSILVTAEYFTQNYINVSPSQIELWDKLTTQLQDRSFARYITEVHYVDLDNPKHQNVDVVQNKKNYQLKFQENDRIISVVLFKQKSGDKKSPLAIYNHGGVPSKRIQPKSENPQFIAYAELGFAIACPNYRGRSAENHAQDMKAVIDHLSELDDVDMDKAVLTGISSGTTLNAEILDKPIAQKFAGIFLHTGLYQNPGTISALSRLSVNASGKHQAPPILLVSGAKDSFVSLKTILGYITKLQMMVQDFSYLILDKGGHQLISFISPHHQVPLLEDKPIYTPDDIAQTTKILHKRYNVQEVMLYASHLVEFLDRIAYGDIASIPPHPYEGKIKKPQGRHILHKAQTLQSLKAVNTPASNALLMKLNEGMKKAPYTSSESHLKIVLGDNFDPNDLDKTILAFLKLYDSEKAKILQEFGKMYPQRLNEWAYHMEENLTENEELRAFIRKILENERHYKGVYVAYHGADSKVGFLYDVYSTLRRLFLIEKPGDENKHVKVLRALDDAFLKFLSADDLIAQMQTLKSQHPSELFNYLPGYQDVGIAAQWYLFGSYKYWGSSTFFNYFRQNSSSKKMSIQKSLEELFMALGIKNKQTLSNISNHYQSIYEQYVNKNDGRLFQIFISPSVVDDIAYVAEIGGPPLDVAMDAASPPTHTPSNILRKSLFDPLKFEEILQNNRGNFKAQSRKDREEFTFNDPSLKYINSLEARLFMKPQFMEDPSKIQIIDYHFHKFEKGYHEALQKQAYQDLSLWMDLDLHLTLAMTHKKPPLVKLQDYVRQGLGKSPGTKQYKRQAPQLSTLLLAKKWQKAEIFIHHNSQPLESITDDQGRPLLYYFLSNNNLEAAQWLITHNVSLPEKQILDLIDENKMAGIDILFEKHPKLKSQIVQYDTLTSMIKDKRSNVCLWIIKNGAQVQENYDGSDTMLILAAGNGLTDVVKALIAKMQEAEPEKLRHYINYKNANNRNALELAISHGHRDTALDLIELGADLGVIDEQGNTPLMLAAKMKDLTDVVKALIDKMLKTNPDKLVWFLDYKNNKGLKALDLAIDVGNSQSALVLVQAGTSINLNALKFATHPDNKNFLLTMIDAETQKEDIKDNSLLLLALEEGLTNVVKTLIAKIKDINPKKLQKYLDYGNGAALKLAISKNNNEIALDFIKEGAEITNPNDEGETPLTLASHDSLTDIVKALIAKMQELAPEKLQHYINHKNTNNSTALQVAIEDGQQDVALVLIEAGAQFNIMDDQGNTLLMLAASTGLTDVVKVLIAKMQVIAPEKLQQEIDYKKDNNTNALSLAINRGHRDTALVLIEAGAKIDVIDEHRNTLLIVTAWKGLTDVTKALIQKMKETEPKKFQHYINFKDTRNWNALQVAVNSGYHGPALVLIEAGTQIDVIDEYGNTPLIVAAEMGLTDVVKVLIAKMREKDTNSLQQYINHKDSSNRNALQLAIGEDQHDTALALIEAGAKIDIIDAQGRTPLSVAAQKGLTDVVKALIQKMKENTPAKLREYVTLKDSGNKSAYDFAYSNKHSEICDILIDASQP